MTLQEAWTYYIENIKSPHGWNPQRVFEFAYEAGKAAAQVNK